MRVTHLHNNWKLTPLKNNELNIVFTQDTDIGGAPYPLVNVALQEGMFMVMRDMEKLLSKERYKNAKVDYILDIE